MRLGKLRAGSPVNKDQAFEERKEGGRKKQRTKERERKKEREQETKEVETEEKKDEARPEHPLSKETNWGIARQA